MERLSNSPLLSILHFIKRPFSIEGYIASKNKAAGIHLLHRNDPQVFSTIEAQALSEASSHGGMFGTSAEPPDAVLSIRRFSTRPASFFSR
jgi:hypothetical protein